MDTVQYSLTNQELFFIVAQCCWDTFLILILATIITLPIAFLLAFIELKSNQGQ